MLVSLYFGLYKPHYNNVYGVFCRIIANDKMFPYAQQILLALITIGLLVYIKWYYLAIAVFINTVAVLVMEFFRYRKNKKEKES